MQYQRLFRIRRWIVAIAALMLAGCYYDDEATLYPNETNCDTTLVATFDKDVLPLLNVRCNSCHSGSSPSGNIKLDTYAEVMKYVDNGSLMGSINHASGFSAMPKNGSKLSLCEIRKIQTWIDAGAAGN